MCVAAAIGAAATVAGAGISAYGATSAANTQADAAKNAQAISLGEFNTITGQQAPYRQAGQAALGPLEQGLGIGGNPSAPGYGSLTAPFTQQTFKQYSPAYQFQLQQGRQGVLNADSSGQGALSGAALKDLTSFNQGLAGTSFNNAFNQYQTQQSNIYNRLAGIANLGQNAAANTGQAGVALAGQAAQSAQNIGTAQAGGIVGASNALSGGLSNAALLGALSSGGYGGFGGENLDQYAGAFTSTPSGYQYTGPSAAYVQSP